MRTHSAKAKTAQTEKKQRVEGAKQGRAQSYAKSILPRKLARGEFGIFKPKMARSENPVHKFRTDQLLFSSQEIFFSLKNLKPYLGTYFGVGEFLNHLFDIIFLSLSENFCENILFISPSDYY